LVNTGASVTASGWRKERLELYEFLPHIAGGGWDGGEESRIHTSLSPGS